MWLFVFQQICAFLFTTSYMSVALCICNCVFPFIYHQMGVSFVYQQLYIKKCVPQFISVTVCVPLFIRNCVCPSVHQQKCVSFCISANVFDLTYFRKCVCPVYQEKCVSSLYKQLCARLFPANVFVLYISICVWLLYINKCIYLSIYQKKFVPSVHQQMCVSICILANVCVHLNVSKCLRHSVYKNCLSYSKTTNVWVRLRSWTICVPPCISKYVCPSV